MFIFFLNKNVVSGFLIFLGLSPCRCASFSPGRKGHLPERATGLHGFLGRFLAGRWLCLFQVVSIWSVCSSEDFFHFMPYRVF